MLHFQIAMPDERIRQTLRKLNLLKKKKRPFWFVCIHKRLQNSNRLLFVLTYWHEYTLMFNQGGITQQLFFLYECHRRNMWKPRHFASQPLSKCNEVERVFFFFLPVQVRTGDKEPPQPRPPSLVSCSGPNDDGSTSKARGGKVNPKQTKFWETLNGKKFWLIQVKFGTVTQMFKRKIE